MGDKWKQRKEQLKNMKQADKPRKAETNYKPPGVTARRIGAGLIWAMLMFMFLVVLVTFLSRGAEKEAKVELPPPNLATTQEAVDFAKQFAGDFFTWTPTADGWETRISKLEPHLAKGLDEQAGLLIADQEWTSALKSASLASISETGKNQALITLRVKQDLKRTKDDGTEETKSAEHFFTIPVGFADAYGVYDLPSFTAIPEKTAVTTDTIEGEPLEADTETNVKNFLTTFFDSYATDTSDKLSYVLDTGEIATGLEGSLAFVEVREAAIVQGAEPGQFKAAATVVMEEPESGTQFLANYRLVIEQVEDRYVVTKLNEGVE